MTIKLYKKLFLANSIYYGHNYINCMDNEEDSLSYRIYYCEKQDNNGYNQINNINSSNIINTNNSQNINNINNIQNINNINNNQRLDNTNNIQDINNINNIKNINNINNIQSDNINNEFNSQVVNIECDKNVVNMQNKKTTKTFLNKKRKNISKNINNNNSVDDEKKLKRPVYNFKIVCNIFTNFNNFLIDHLNYLLPYKKFSCNIFIRLNTLSNSTLDKCKKYFKSNVCDVIPKMSTKYTISTTHNKELYEKIMKKQYDDKDKEDYSEIINALKMSIEDFYNKKYIRKNDDGTYEEESPFNDFVEKAKGDEDYKARVREVGYNINDFIEKGKYKK